MGKDIIGDGDKGVFLAEHFATILHDCQTVNVGVNHETNIGATFLNKRSYVGEVCGNGFGSVGEASVRLAVKLDDILHAKGAEKFGNNHTANRVDAIHGHREAGLGNRVGIHQGKGEHIVDMLAVVGIVHIYFAEFVDGCEHK